MLNTTEGFLGIKSLSAFNFEGAGSQLIKKLNKNSDATN
jgi:hypothetical protein